MQIKLLKSKKLLLVISSLSMFIFMIFIYKTQESKLEQQMKSNVEATKNNQVVHEQLIEKPIPKKPNKSKKASDEDIRFVVSRDYNAVMACQKMLSNSLNKDLQAQWVQERLSNIAQRERTQYAESALKEQEAIFQAMQLEQRKKAFDTENSHSAVFTNESAKDWPKISLISISDSELATFELDDSTFVDKKVGDFIQGDYLLSKIDANDKCLNFVSSKSGSKRVCI